MSGTMVEVRNVSGVQAVAPHVLVLAISIVWPASTLKAAACPLSAAPTPLVELQLLCQKVLPGSLADVPSVTTGLFVMGGVAPPGLTPLSVRVPTVGAVWSMA